MKLCSCRGLSGTLLLADVIGTKVYLLAHVTKKLTHLSLMEFPNLINWINPIWNLRAVGLGTQFQFHSNFKVHSVSKH